jgi:NTE family protein
MDIALALGGGGSRGYAHIGVIRRLEAEGFRIRAVAGTSAGGIVAAIYAAGYTPAEMEARFAKIDQPKLFSFSMNEGPGLLGLSNARKILLELLVERPFEDLKLPCAVTAVDVRSGREITLNRGPVVDAVMATIAVPGVFPPRRVGDLDLVDGAVLNPVPVSVARSLAPGLPVAAVALSAPMEAPRNFHNLPLPVKVPAPILGGLSRLRLTQAFEIFIQSVEIGQRMVTELRLEVDEPEVIIRPAVSNIGLLDRVDVHELIRLGDEAAEAVLPDLARAVSWTGRVGRRLFPRGQRRREAGRLP